MTRACLTLFIFLLAAPFWTAAAETYTWTDEQGTAHFTEDLGSVPKKARKQSRKVVETEQATEKPAAPLPTATGKVIAPHLTPGNDNGEAGVAETYAGKTYDQWEKDFASQEAAMTALRKRIDEITSQLNNFADNWEEQKKLLTEHKSLVDQFKGMKAHYLQQVEIVRKAGLQINIQQ